MNFLDMSSQGFPLVLSAPYILPLESWKSAALKTENFGGLFSAIYHLVIHR
jgi:hypothetical protein